jgi:RNA polymerase sigma-70 factor (ECF subfamily)
MSARNENFIDTAAFELLFKANFRPLCGWCQYKFDLEPDLAKEAVHTGFIKLWENRHSITPELSVKAYLYKIVTNICLNIFRDLKVKQKHLQYLSQNTFILTNDDGFDQCTVKQLTSDIDKAISELPEQMRRIFLLSRKDGLKHLEISTLLDISIKTVETQISRARIKLRRKLSGYLTAIGIVILFSQ